jgi:CelD/BcsL family acetyltransferase involved in cellulose biosynthesis
VSTGATSAATTRLVEVDPVLDPRWDELARRHPDAVVYHLGAWAETLRRAYGARPRYLALEGPDGGLRGGLPLMRTRGLVAGVRYRTLPVVPPAGPLADSGADLEALVRGACEMTREDGAKVWTLHTRTTIPEELVPELEPIPKYPTYVQPLSADPDEMRAGWKKSSSNLFRNLKKADKSGVTVRSGTSDRELRDFYRLYATTMKKHKVLPRLYRQIRVARDLLAPDGHVRLFVAEHEGRAIAAGLFHSFRGRLELLYNGSDESALDLRPNFSLYWQAITWACETGHTEYDWGHARPESRLARFKLQWGSEVVPEYRYDFVPGRTASAERARSISHVVDAGEGRSARLIGRMPVPLLRAGAFVAYRYL